MQNAEKKEREKNERKNNKAVLEEVGAEQHSLGESGEHSLVLLLNKKPVARYVLKLRHRVDQEGHLSIQDQREIDQQHRRQHFGPDHLMAQTQDEDSESNKGNDSEVELDCLVHGQMVRNGELDVVRQDYELKLSLIHI